VSSSKLEGLRFPPRLRAAGNVGHGGEIDLVGYAGIGLKEQAREHVEQEMFVFADGQRVVDANGADSDLGDATGRLEPALSEVINELPLVISSSASTHSPPIVDALLANCIFNLPWAFLKKGSREAASVSAMCRGTRRTCAVPDVTGN
jgi:hypothetical protein